MYIPVYLSCLQNWKSLGEFQLILGFLERITLLFDFFLNPYYICSFLIINTLISLIIPSVHFLNEKDL